MKHVKILKTILLLAAALMLTLTGCNLEQPPASEYELYIVNAGGSSVTNILNIKGQMSWVSWSPDGTKIVLIYNNDIHLMNPDGSDLINITNSDSNESQLNWSPDSTKILYSNWANSTSMNSQKNLYIINADGTGLVQLTNDDNSKHNHQWSPDSSKVIYSSYNQDDYSQDIYAVNADGTGTTNLTGPVIDPIFVPAAPWSWA